MTPAIRWVALAFMLMILPTATAQAPPVGPEQVHVTLAADGLVIQFALSGVPYANTQTPVVLYSIDGAAQQSAAATVAGTVAAVGASDGYPTTVYAATIRVLPGQNVTYQTGDAVRGYAGPFTIRRPDDGPLRFAFLADIGYEGVAADGTGPATAAPIAMRDLTMAQKPELLLIGGDLSYANTRLGWDRFMRMHSPLQATVPTMPSIGNHEHDATANYGQFLANYVLPGNEQDFAFQSGPVTFVAVNSDGICNNNAGRSGSSLLAPCADGLNEERLAWLEQELKAAQADETPWTVVYMHHPPFSWGSHGNDWATQIYWNPLFEKYGVDLVLTAHDHLYSRSHPIIKRDAVANGSEYAKGTAPIYIVLGGGGRPLYTVPGGEPPSWVAHAESVHHVGLFDVDVGRLEFQALRIDGTVMDSFAIADHIGPASNAGSERAPGPALLVLALALLVFASLRRTR